LKKEIFWLLPIFVLIILALFGVHYFYLSQNGFDSLNYIIAFIILLPASAVIGYIFLAVALQKFQTHEENLEHLIKEVLHEINLPISTIDANIKILKRAEKSGKNIKRLERIEASLRKLQKLYRQLSYQIKRELAPVEKEYFDLSELVNSEIEHFISLGFNRFERDLDRCEILADKIGLEQVIANILENALKYSTENIEIKLKEDTLSIKDYGFGISENELLNITKDIIRAIVQ